jgi:hypothetical protein
VASVLLHFTKSQQCHAVGILSVTTFAVNIECGSDVRVTHLKLFSARLVIRGARRS